MRTKSRACKRVLPVDGLADTPLPPESVDIPTDFASAGLCDRLGSVVDTTMGSPEFRIPGSFVENLGVPVCREVCEGSSLGTTSFYECQRQHLGNEVSRNDIYDSRSCGTPTSNTHEKEVPVAGRLNVSNDSSYSLEGTSCGSNSLKRKAACVNDSLLETGLKRQRQYSQVCTTGGRSVLKRKASVAHNHLSDGSCRDPGQPSQLQNDQCTLDSYITSNHLPLLKRRAISAEDAPLQTHKNDIFVRARPTRFSTVHAPSDYDRVTSRQSVVLNFEAGTVSPTVSEDVRNQLTVPIGIRGDSQSGGMPSSLRFRPVDANSAASRENVPCGVRVPVTLDFQSKTATPSFEVDGPVTLDFQSQTASPFFQGRPFNTRASDSVHSTNTTSTAGSTSYASQQYAFDAPESAPHQTHCSTSTAGQIPMPCFRTFPPLQTDLMQNPVKEVSNANLVRDMFMFDNKRERQFLIKQFLEGDYAQGQSSGGQTNTAVESRDKEDKNVDCDLETNKKHDKHEYVGVQSNSDMEENESPDVNFDEFADIRKDIIAGLGSSKSTDVKDQLNTRC